MEHNLQSWEEFFTPTIMGIKTHEVRQTSDPLSVDGNNAPISMGDVLVLHEFNPETQVYTGRTARVLVTWISPNPSSTRPWINPDWVEMSIKLLPTAPNV